MTKVLLVDDEPALLEVAAEFMRSEDDLMVTTAQSAQEALRLLGEQTFDVLVSDYQMPGADGIELLKKVRAEDRDIQFILFTGKGREEVAMDALNHGANAYRQKGGDPRSQFGELIHTIKDLARKREAERRVQEAENERATILNNISEMVSFQDMEMRVQWTNWSKRILKNLRTEEVIGRQCFEVLYGRDSVCEGCPVLRAMERGEAYLDEYVTPDGRTWRMKVTPIRDADGNVVGAVEVASETVPRR
jgi:CheY-like chemotaxis protein